MLKRVICWLLIILTTINSMPNLGENKANAEESNDQSKISVGTIKDKEELVDLEQKNLKPFEMQMDR